jgi:hypothetical protein
MAKFSDWSTAQDAKDITERFVERFPDVFEGFDADGIFFIQTQTKTSKVPVKVKALGYPAYIVAGKPYVVEVFEKWWKEMDDRQKNIAVFDAMSFIPDGGFDEQSKHYGKVTQPEIKMHMSTFAATGGVPNWFENPAAKDPMARTAQEMSEDVPVVDAITEDSVPRTPVTVDDVADVGSADAAA